jgi:hypothetical protein
VIVPSASSAAKPIDPDGVGRVDGEREVLGARADLEREHDLGDQLARAAADDRPEQAARLRVVERLREALEPRDGRRRRVPRALSMTSGPTPKRDRVPPAATVRVDDREGEAPRPIEGFPEEQAAETLRLLDQRADPLMLWLDNAPPDDEPVTQEEEAAVHVARDEIARGETISLEEFLAELDAEQR